MLTLSQNKPTKAQIECVAFPQYKAQYRSMCNTAVHLEGSDGQWKRSEEQEDDVSSSHQGPL